MSQGFGVTRAEETNIKYTYTQCLFWKDYLQVALDVKNHRWSEYSRMFTFAKSGDGNRWSLDYSLPLSIYLKLFII